MTAYSPCAIFFDSLNCWSQKVPQLNQPLAVVSQMVTDDEYATLASSMRPILARNSALS